MKRPCRSGDEYDAFSGWKRLLKYLSRAGIRAEIKRRYRRRERHEAKKELKDQLMEIDGDNGSETDEEALQHALQHALEVARRCEGTACGKDHADLARWLEELHLRRTGSWPK